MNHHLYVLCTKCGSPAVEDSKGGYGCLVCKTFERTSDKKNDETCYKCECGSQSIGSNKHSNWCVMYKENV